MLLPLVLVVGLGALAAVPLAARRGRLDTPQARGKLLVVLAVGALVTWSGLRWWFDRSVERHAENVAVAVATQLVDIDGTAVDPADPPALDVEGFVRWDRLDEDDPARSVVAVRVQRGRATRCIVTVLGPVGEHVTQVFGSCRLPDGTAIR